MGAATATGAARNKQREREREKAKREALARWRADVRRRLPEITSLDFDEWSLLIEDWNALSAKERRAIAASCSRTGHDDATTPIGKHVCKRCLRYTEDR